MWRLFFVLTVIQSVSLADLSLQENETVTSNSGFINVQERIKNVPTKKSEIVKNFLNHFNSLKPVAILVDDVKETNSAAKNFMKSVFEIAPNAGYIQFFMLKFNSSGISPILKISGNDTEKIEQFFESHNEEFSYLGFKKPNGTVAFFAILNAAATLPQNSAILIFIDRKIADEDLARHTALLKKKNIRVYVVWGGVYPTKISEDHLLRQLCSYTEGLFLVNSGNLSSFNYRTFLENGFTNLNTSIILSKVNILGASDYSFPVDSQVTAVHISITPFIQTGTIFSPNGDVINILKDDEIASYSTGSFGVTELGLHEVHLNMTAISTHSVGFWRLTLNNTLAPYNVTVFAYTKLTAHAYFISKNAGSQNSTGSGRKIMKLGISGYVTAISNISFLDLDGQSTIDKAKYTTVKDAFVMKNDKTNSYRNKEIEVEIFNGSYTPFYALIEGKDAKGHDFVRLTYITSYDSSDIFPQQTLSIDVGLGSELITTGGKSAVILFEVTNQRSTAVDVRFSCSDQRYLLRSMQPYRKILNPQEIAVVRVTLATKYGTYQDELTFKASLGSETFEKRVYVDVGTQAMYDYVEPELDYSFSSDCSNVIFSNCESGTWTVQVKARDTGAGILQVTSNPSGLYFPNGYTTGTKEEITGYYSGSCCSPDLQLIAIDRLNNRRTKNLNAYLATWGAAQISALVLGILILILIIILVVYLITKCIKKRKNYDLPTYRGGKI